MKAYSLDLRQRVLTAALSGEHTIAEVAELFGTGTTFVNKMLRLHREGADLAPRPHGGGQKACLSAALNLPHLVDTSISLFVEPHAVNFNCAS
jgi:transposase